MTRTRIVHDLPEQPSAQRALRERSYQQMWREFRGKHAGGPLSDMELYAIHKRWRSLGKKTQRGRL